MNIGWMDDGDMGLESSALLCEKIASPFLPMMPASHFQRSLGLAIFSNIRGDVDEAATSAAICGSIASPFLRRMPASLSWLPWKLGRSASCTRPVTCLTCRVTDMLWCDAEPPFLILLFSPKPSELCLFSEF